MRLARRPVRLDLLLVGLVALGGTAANAPRPCAFDAWMSPPAAAARRKSPHQIHFTFTAPDAVTFGWIGSDGTLRYWARDIPPANDHRAAAGDAPVSSPGPW